MKRLFILALCRLADLLDGWVRRLDRAINYYSKR